MTDQQHPINPSWELQQQWREQAPRYRDGGAEREEKLVERAAQWGADQELEACCELLKQKGVPARALLRLHRRPKPPSLKEQALEDLESLVSDLANHGMGFKATNIRRALEALPDD